MSTHNHLVSLAKWLGVRLQTKWLWIRIPLLSLDPFLLLTLNLYLPLVENLEKFSTWVQTHLKKILILSRHNDVVSTSIRRPCNVAEVV